MKTRAGNTLRQFALLAFLGLVPACGSNPNTNLVTSGNPYGVAPASSPSNPNTVNGFNQNQDIMPLLPGIPMWGPGMLPMAEDPCCCCDPCANARSRRNRRTRPAHSSSSGTSSSSSSSSSGSSNDDQDGSNRSRDDSDRTLPAQIVMRYQDDGKNQIDYHLQIGADGKTIQIRLNSIDGKTQPLTIPLSPTDDPALNQSVQNLVNRQIPVWNGSSNGTDRVTLQIDDLNHPKNSVTVTEPTIQDPKETDLFDRIRDYIRKHLTQTPDNPQTNADGQTTLPSGPPGDDADDHMQQVIDNVDDKPVPAQARVSDDTQSQVQEVPSTDSPKDARDQAIAAFDQAEVRFSTQNLYFATGKADLSVSKKTPAGAKGGETTTLKQVIKTGRLFATVQDKIKSITIVGQADKVGKDVDNLVLSGKRAKRVAAVMTDPDSYKGLESTGLSIKPLEAHKVFVNGIGEPDASSCKDGAGRAVENCPDDRRVWFFIDLVDSMSPEEKSKLMSDLNKMMTEIWGTELQTVPDKPKTSTNTKKKRTR